MRHVRCEEASCTAAVPMQQREGRLEEEQEEGEERQEHARR